MTDHQAQDGPWMTDQQPQDLHLPYAGPAARDPGSDDQPWEEDEDVDTGQGTGAAVSGIRPPPKGLSRRDRHEWRTLEVARSSGKPKQPNSSPTSSVPGGAKVSSATRPAGWAGGAAARGWPPNARAPAAGGRPAAPATRTSTPDPSGCWSWSC